jgi:predicted Zn finger-like uncharacterized protein
MIIVCPKCSTRLQIDDEKSPNRPFNVRCPKCSNTLVPVRRVRQRNRAHLQSEDLRRPIIRALSNHSARLRACDSE